jgi:hypothetical protein
VTYGGVTLSASWGDVEDSVGRVSVLIVEVYGLLSWAGSDSVTFITSVSLFLTSFVAA